MELIEYLLTFTKELEGIFQEDLKQKTPVRRVTRIFTGKDILPVSSSTGFTLGNALLSFKKSNQYYDHQLTYLARDNKVNRYNLPDSISYNGFSAFFSFFEEEESRSANALIERGPDDEIISLVDLGFYIEYKDKRFFPSELDEIKDQVCNMVVRSVCDTIDWSEFENERTDNFRVRAQYILSLEAYKKLAALTREKYKASIEETIMQQHYSAFRNVRTSPFADNCFQNKCTRLDLYSDSIKFMIHDLDLAFHSDDLEIAYKAFTNLRWNPVFAAIGGRILMNMFTPEDRQKYSVTIIEVNGSNRTPIEVIVADGISTQKAELRRELYDYVKNIQTTIFNRGFDLRLQGVYGDLEHLNP